MLSMTKYHNIYEIDGEQFTGSELDSRADADRIADCAHAANIRRIAVVRCYPKLFIEVKL